MAEQGRTLSFQLSTGNVDDLSNVTQTDKGHFVQVLNPPAYVPFYAEPKVALYALSFANTFANVETAFGNDDIVFQYYDSTAVAYKEVKFKIDTGNYNRSDLEIAIAQGLKNDSDCWKELTKVAKTVEAKANDKTAPATPLTAAAGVADPNVAEQWMPTSNNQPLTFLELSELVSKNVAYVATTDRYIKPVTIRHNPQTNRIEIITLGQSEFCKGSTLLSKTLGYDDSQLPTVATDEHWTQVSGKATGAVVKIPDGALSLVNGKYGDATKQRAAEIDNVRSLGFHLPSLVQSSYDRNGEEKGAQVASVPIRALPGNSEAWEVQSPLWMPCPVAGSYIDSIEFFVTNERGQRVDCQGGHIEATVVVSWPTPVGQAPPPSSLAARLDASRVIQPWANLKR